MSLGGVESFALKINSTKLPFDAYNTAKAGINTSTSLSSSTALALDASSIPARTYTVQQGFTSLAKIGVGLLAADVLTRQIYPNQKDKRLHSLAGGIISGVSSQIGTAITGNKFAGIAIGIGAGVVAGVAKELIDMQGYGTPDVHDFWATALGSVTVGITLSF